jgi:hypothetical protein
MHVLFWNDNPENALVLGPFSSVEETSNEIRVPIDLDTMDDEAERFFCEAQLMGIPFSNLFAVQQKGGSWELRELAGKWAYEVFENVKVLET